ncbi:MAG: hypothetical protein R2735_03835 [Microthrixaceae bacterium]
MYQKRSGYHGVILEPIAAGCEGRLRNDVARVTQNLAYALEDLIRRAPTQWHVLQPNWPSDRKDLAPKSRA